MIPYTIFRVIVALVAGAIFYIIDRRGGTGLYRWWYGMTHEHPLPGHVHRGFVYNRNTRNRVVAATILSSLIAIPALMYGGHNALLELGLWLLSIPVIVGAFMVGPRIAALWGKRDDVYNAVDKWERGEAEPAAEARLSSAPSATGPDPATGAGAGTAATTAAHGTSHTVEPPDEPTTEVPHPEPESDPQELVNRFINRGQS